MKTTININKCTDQLSDDDLYQLISSTLWQLKGLLLAADMLRNGRTKLIKQISTDERCRAKCVEILKVLDFAEWSSESRVADAKRVNGAITAALSAGGLHVTNEMLAQKIDAGLVALEADITADEINTINPSQAGREAIYQAIGEVSADVAASAGYRKRERYSLLNFGLVGAR